MAGGKVSEGLVVPDPVEDTVCGPGGAGAQKLPVGGAQGEEDGIIHLLIISDEVEFIGIHHV